MKRVLALIPRKPGLTRASFRDHYETVHAPLGMSVLGDIVHYVRNHIMETIGEVEPSFDVLSEFGYADAKEMEAVTERLATKELGDPIRADERSFLDKPRITVLLLDRIASRTGPGASVPAETHKLVLLEKVPSDANRSAFIRRHVQRVDGLRDATSYVSFESLDSRAPYDVVSFLRYPVASAAASSLRRELVSEDRALLLRVDECATKHSLEW